MASSPTLLAGQDMTALTMGVPAWTAMTLLNSWTNAGAGNVAAQYRKWPLLNSVEIIGTIARTPSAATAFFTLPAGNIPASQQQFAAGTAGGTGTNNTTFIQCDASGNLTVQQPPTNTTINVAFHGWISLDA